jgi:hypothetical protein
VEIGEEELMAGQEINFFQAVEHYLEVMMAKHPTPDEITCCAAMLQLVREEPEWAALLLMGLEQEMQIAFGVPFPEDGKQAIRDFVKEHPIVNMKSGPSYGFERGF